MRSFSVQFCNYEYVQAKNQKEAIDLAYRQREERLGFEPGTSDSDDPIPEGWADSVGQVGEIFEFKKGNTRWHYFNMQDIATIKEALIKTGNTKLVKSITDYEEYLNE